MIRKLITGIACVIVAAVLPACDAITFEKLRPGVSTALEVRDLMGAPTMEWKEADGSVVWEYPRTPNGVENFMITIGPDKVLREIRQVLTDENFARVSPGMSKEDIRRLLGKPASEVYFERKKELVWDWKTKSEGNSEWFFNVHFDEAGRVLRTSTSQAPGA